MPAFGICYGFQAMALALGGTVARTGSAEFGRTDAGGGGRRPDAVPRPARATRRCGCRTTTRCPRRPPASPWWRARPTPRSRRSRTWPRGLAGVQFHPEVLHSEHGQAVLEHFLYEVAGIEPTWTMTNVIDEQVEAIRAQVGTARVICGLSGGVDSAVAAALVHRAVGDQLTCVFVDHGLLRKGEAEQVERDFVAATGVRLKVGGRVEAVPRGAGRRQRPRGEAQGHRPRVHPGLRGGRPRGGGRGRRDGESVDFLVQGTLYPDVVESGGGTGTANIKSHHNVGGLPDDLQFALVEPLRTLFKDEVRKVGARARAARGDRLAAAVPGPGPGDPDRRRGDARAARRAARGRRDRPRGADRGRAGPGDLAVPGRAARRRPVGGRAGRRAHLRAPGGAAARVVGGRDDRGLDPGARTTCWPASRPASPTRSARSTGSRWT